MADPFVAEIRMFPFNFAPKGWAFCDGQLLPLSQNTALFSLLGTTYGGDGKSNFALPNLKGRTPIHPGQGPGLSLRGLGETGGAVLVDLTLANAPVHTHAVELASASEAVDAQPAGGAPAVAAFAAYGNPAVGPTGATSDLLVGSGPTSTVSHSNLQPFLTLNFCIALQGVYPPRT